MAGCGGKPGKGKEELGKTAVDPQQGGSNYASVGNFFKAVVQQVLLFGAEAWVVSPRMERALSSFIHGAARQITGRLPRSGWDGKWFYPSLEGAMKEAGFTDVRTSINRRQNTVAQYIATRPLLDLCKGAAKRGGARVTIRWWDQNGIDWEKAKARGAETESKYESEKDMEGEATRDAEIRARSLSGAEWSRASADEWEVMQTSSYTT